MCLICPKAAVTVAFVSVFGFSEEGGFLMSQMICKFVSLDIWWIGRWQEVQRAPMWWEVTCRLYFSIFSKPHLGSISRMHMEVAYYFKGSCNMTDVYSASGIDKTSLFLSWSRTHVIMVTAYRSKLKKMTDDCEKKRLSKVVFQMSRLMWHQWRRCGNCKKDTKSKKRGRGETG